MKKYFLLILLIIIPIFVFAISVDDIAYPVEELGNCADKEECRVYCNQFDNTESCFNFSLRNNLFLSCDSSKILKFIELLKNGISLPCNSKTECLDFCSNPENLEQCLAFGQEIGALSRQQALLFKRTKGIGPGQCNSEEGCRNYCSQESNVDECLAFALNNGFISQAQAAEAIRLRDIALQGGPGGCRGLEECRDYCSFSANFEECINFGKESGILTEEKAEEIEEFIKEGGPGGCRTEKECLDYCNLAENALQCVEFMIKGGYVPKESIEAVEKKLKEVEESITSQIKEYEEKFNADMNEEEIMKQIEEVLRPYREMLESSLRPKRSIAQRIIEERSQMQDTEEPESYGIIDVFTNLFASIASKILNR